MSESPQPAPQPPKPKKKKTEDTRQLVIELGTFVLSFD